MQNIDKNKIAPFRGREHALFDWAVSAALTAVVVVLTVGTAVALRRDNVSPPWAVGAGCLVGAGFASSAGWAFDRWRAERRGQ